jgi:hypothetical protein
MFARAVAQVVQNEDLTPDGRGNLVDLLPANVAGVKFQVTAAHRHHAKARLLLSFFHLAPLSDKNGDGHGNLLGSNDSISACL